MSQLSISAFAIPEPNSLLDAPWQLPSFSSSSPLFKTPDLPAASDPDLSMGEFGGGFKPSTSAERLKGESSENGGSIGSASGRSPRLTKESIRRKMEAKKLEQQHERDKAAGIFDVGSSEWRPVEGLGIGIATDVATVRIQKQSDLPSSRSSSPTKERPDRALPLPPTALPIADPSPKSPFSSQAMSRPKGATSDVAPASIKSHHEERPALRPRANTLSAQDILSTESALERLALGQSQNSLNECIKDKEIIKDGSEKEVRVETKRVIGAESSSPIEGNFDHAWAQPITNPSILIPASDHYAISTGTTLSAAEKARRDAELMPPPPLPTPRVPHLHQSHNDVVPVGPSSPAPSDHSSTSGNEGTRGREEAINARKRERRGEVGERGRKGKGRRSLSTGDSTMLDVRIIFHLCGIIGSKGC